MRKFKDVDMTEEKGEKKQFKLLPTMACASY